MKDEEKITKIALISRLFLIVLQFVANLLIPDHNAGVFLYLAPKSKGYYDNLIEYLFGGFLRWDAQYFMHIARHGYTYENTLAFFPLYPLTVATVGNFVHSFVTVCNLDSILLLVFIILNVIFVKYAAVALYRLTETIFNQKIAFTSAILFVFNPASIFFIAPYTECMFAYFSFLSMLNCIKIYRKYLKPKAVFSFTDIFYLLPIALSTVVRSNGLLNIGFLIYTILCLLLNNLQSKKTFYDRCILCIKYLTTTTVVIINCLLPFIGYQYYCYKMFCNTFNNDFSKDILDLARKKKYVLSGTFQKHNQTWCHKTLPLAYNYVQDHYWNVGFLRYYKFKQIPNFILAMPIIFILSRFCVKHLLYNFNWRKPLSFFTLDKKDNSKSQKNIDVNFSYPEINVFVVHALFLTIFCVFFVHIQVSTRMLCSSTPLFYWICSTDLNLLKIPSKKDSLKELFFRTYFVSYFIAGTLLFCNFLPWT